MYGTMRKEILMENQLDPVWVRDYKAISDYIFWTEPNFMDNFSVNEDGQGILTKRLREFNESLEPEAGTEKITEDMQVEWVVLPSTRNFLGGWFWCVKKDKR